MSTTIMNTEPLITILLPTYNRADLLPFAIESAVNQNYKKLELLIVDDGSTDCTKKCVAKYLDGNVYYYYKNHTNAADSRNYGAQRAKGELILFLDSDDILLPDAVETLVREYQKYNDGDVFYGDSYVINEKGTIIGEHRHTDHTSIDKLLSLSIYDSPVYCSGTVVRKEAILKEPFDPTYDVDEDYELWSRWLLRYKFRHVNCFTFKVRQHGNRLNRTHPSKKRAADILERILKKYEWKKLFPDLDWSDEAKAIVKAYTEIAKVFLRYRRPDKSLYYIEKCDEHLRTVDTINMLAVAMMVKGQREQAKVYLHKAIKLDPLNIQVLRNGVIIEKETIICVIKRAIELIQKYGLFAYLRLFWRWANGITHERVYVENYDFDLNICVKTREVIRYKQ